MNCFPQSSNQQSFDVIIALPPVATCLLNTQNIPQIWNKEKKKKRVKSRPVDNRDMGRDNYLWVPTREA